MVVVEQMGRRGIATPSFYFILNDKTPGDTRCS